MIRALLASFWVTIAPAPATAPSPAPAPVVRQCVKDCRTTEAGIALIRRYEGYSPYPYLCPAGLRTIGYGHVMQKGRDYPIPLVGDAAEKLLMEDIAKHEAPVNRAVTVPLWPLQFDALSSFTFNLGGGAFRSSTLLKRVNAERHAEVPAQFERWVFAAGKRLRGLERRRADEAALYEKARP